MNTILFWYILFKGTVGLRLMRLEVPSAAIRGEPVWLNCTFDLESDELYSVKWYKNNVEFYRFLPTDQPPGQKYDLMGVYVDVRTVGLRLMRLEVPSAAIRGEPVWLNCTFDLESDELYSVKWYKNNVEFYRFLPTDQPPGQKYDLMGVYVDSNLMLPEDGPTITGIKPQYQIGDEVNVTCSAGPSKPAATLKWYINGKEAPVSYETRTRPLRHKDRLQISTLGLNFEARPVHFWNGSMKLRCTAVISQAYSMSSEEIIVGDNARASGFHSGLLGDGPTITGGKPKYQVGDEVNVNCTSAKSKPPAELLWFINDQPVINDRRVSEVENIPL
ncbi:uncharacterized protein LOC111612923 [Centruroides sculpturatus]|uniref:uncharacterized protein LOC111612923 n=1 Tax=Centruroides sculpturatus TaxID=218467 RepID=UPI000C6ECACA|nr:uncharacterized protein LOC111612923 [Centruroides sculpturatus]